MASAVHIPGADSDIVGTDDVGGVEEDATGATDILLGHILICTQTWVVVEVYPTLWIIYG